MPFAAALLLSVMPDTPWTYTFKQEPDTALSIS